MSGNWAKLERYWNAEMKTSSHELWWGMTVPIAIAIFIAIVLSLLR